MSDEVQSPDLRNRIREAVTRGDAGAVLSLSRQLLAASEKTADVMFCAATFRQMGDALCSQLGLKKLKTYVVRSVTLEPVLPFLTVAAVMDGYVLDVSMGGYGSYVDELLNPDGELGRSRPDLVLVVLDMEELAGRLPESCADGIGSGVEQEIEDCAERVGQLLRSFRASSNARLLLQGLVLPDRTSLGDVADANLPHSLTNALASLNRKLAGLCSSISDCVFFDVDRVAARHGRARWSDTRMYLASRLPVAAECFSLYAAGFVRTFSALFRAPRKVLCTDLDNTLWGGILGEDGPEGIATGTAFPGNCYLSYQRYLKQLSRRGVLLAIASKNNEQDVRDVFRSRAADLAVTLDDFVAFRINWNDKAESLREMAEELSFGLDSFVFVDDNPAECEAIHQQLPQVAVISAPVNEPWKLVDVLARQTLFDTISVTGEDLHRTDEYKAQAQRAELARTFGSREDFLASMGIVCTFLSALDAPLARAVQLVAKTNQFNLTTRRRSAAEIEEFASTRGGQAVVVRVRDRFGDAGAVGLALARTSGGICHIDSLLLSCRVIGRGVETALLAQIAEQARRDAAHTLVGEFIATPKNAPCATFYSDHGFTLRPAPQNASSDSIFYELDLTASMPSSPAWIAVEGKIFDELTASPAVSV